MGNHILHIRGSSITPDIDGAQESLAIVGNTIATVREGIQHHWQVGVDEVLS